MYFLWGWPFTYESFVTFFLCASTVSIVRVSNFSFAWLTDWLFLCSRILVFWLSTVELWSASAALLLFLLLLFLFLLLLGCHQCTVGQNNQEYRLEYWVTRSSVRSLARLLCATHFACALRCAHFPHPLACVLTSLTPSLVGQWLIRWLFILFFLLFWPTVQCSQLA